MHDPRPPAMPLQPSDQHSTDQPPTPSGGPVQYYTLREASREAGCSESTLRRLVKSGEVPFVQEETKTGFRYLFEASNLAVIAHKASMRRPSGRPSSRRVGGSTVQPFGEGGLQEASVASDEAAVLRVERDLLRAENARLWLQIERLTESLTQLALPPAKPPDEGPNMEAFSREREPRGRRGFWDWFFGREGDGR